MTEIPIPRTFVVTGTDTGVGKTVFAAALAGALAGYYWKPIQAGLSDGVTDSEVVRSLSGLPPPRILPEAYRLHTPASPHIAAARDGATIDPAKLSLPRLDRPLIVEGAGGLMVPLNREWLQIDLFTGWGVAWGVSLILCARTTLGTINHTLLSLEALQRRKIPVLGLVFMGEPEPEVEQTIMDRAGVRRLGRLPPVAPLDASNLAAAFRENFRLADFAGQ